MSFPFSRSGVVVVPLSGAEKEPVDALLTRLQRALSHLGAEQFSRAGPTLRFEHHPFMLFPRGGKKNPIGAIDGGEVSVVVEGDRLLLRYQVTTTPVALNMVMFACMAGPACLVLIVLGIQAQSLWVGFWVGLILLVSLLMTGGYYFFSVALFSQFLRRVALPDPSGLWYCPDWSPSSSQAITSGDQPAPDRPDENVHERENVRERRRDTL